MFILQYQSPLQLNGHLNAFSNILHLACLTIIVAIHSPITSQLFFHSIVELSLLYIRPLTPVPLLVPHSSHHSWYLFCFPCPSNPSMYSKLTLYSSAPLLQLFLWSSLSSLPFLPDPCRCTHVCVETFPAVCPQTAPVIGVTTPFSLALVYLYLG